MTTLLSIINPDIKDNNLLFNEEEHKYIIKNKILKLVSVTQFIQYFFNEFSSSKAIKQIRKSPNYIQSKYFGVSDSEIMKQWLDIKKEAIDKGINMHRDIEKFFNKELCIHEMKHINHFSEWYNDIGQHIEPYRTEWKIYDEDIKIAGCIDFVSKNNDETFDIYDWKRSKRINLTNIWEKGLYVCNILDNCNYNHYSIQLNMYKYILENKYDKKIKNMYLVILHPNNDNYVLMKINDMSEQIKKMITYYFKY